jgi:hypothetical protein
VELDKSGSYKNLGKRPAGAGLFIGFGAGRADIIQFFLPLGLSRWRGKGVAEDDEQDDYLCPWSILHQGGWRSVVGDKQHLKSSWGGVKINKASENKHKNRKEAVYIM